MRSAARSATATVGGFVFAAREMRHHRGVGDAQGLDAAHAQLWVADRVIGAAHRARPRGWKAVATWLRIQARSPSSWRTSGPGAASPSTMPASGSQAATSLAIRTPARRMSGDRAPQGLARAHERTPVGAHGGHWSAPVPLPLREVVARRLLPQVGRVRRAPIRRAERMVLQPGADAWRARMRRSRGRAGARRAHAGEHQQLRALDRARAQDDVAPGLRLALDDGRAVGGRWRPRLTDCCCAGQRRRARRGRRSRRGLAGRTSPPSEPVDASRHDTVSRPGSVAVRPTELVVLCRSAEPNYLSYLRHTAAKGRRRLDARSPIVHRLTAGCDRWRRESRARRRARGGCEEVRSAMEWAQAKALNHPGISGGLFCDRCAFRAEGSNPRGRQLIIPAPPPAPSPLRRRRCSERRARRSRRPTRRWSMR